MAPPGLVISGETVAVMAPRDLSPLVTGVGIGFWAERRFFPAACALHGSTDGRPRFARF